MARLDLLQYLSILYVLPLAMLHVNNTQQADSDIKNKSNEEKSENRMSQLSIYRHVFKQKRVEQMIAVENILKMDDYARQYKIVKIIFEKLFKVLEDAKVLVRESGYIPGDEFPSKQEHKEAVGRIVENTAFFGDIVLRLPDIAHKIFSKDKEWKLLALWSLSFTNSTTIYDEMDSKLLNLMAQELKLIPREPNYFNPFTEEAKRLRNKLENEEPPVSKGKKKTKKKKKEKAKGPRLSHIEL